jgi:5-bromo-4-chloroindolyl phosphate hydrolysis protein
MSEKGQLSQKDLKAFKKSLEEMRKQIIEPRKWHRRRDDRPAAGRLAC